MAKIKKPSRPKKMPDDVFNQYVKLTDQQRKFCEEYAKEMQTRESVKIAYPNIRTDASRDSHASRLLKNVKVQGYLNWLNDKRVEAIERELEISARSNLEITAAICQSDIADLVDDEGKIKSPIHWPAHARQAVSSYRMGFTKDGEAFYEVRFWNKVGALSLMFDHFGLKKGEQGHGDTLPVTQAEKEKAIEEFQNVPAVPVRPRQIPARVRPVDIPPVNEADVVPD